MARLTSTAIAGTRITTAKEEAMLPSKEKRKPIPIESESAARSVSELEFVSRSQSASKSESIAESEYISGSESESISESMSSYSSTSFVIYDSYEEYESSGYYSEGTASQAELRAFDSMTLDKIITTGVESDMIICLKRIEVFAGAKSKSNYLSSDCQEPKLDLDGENHILDSFEDKDQTSKMAEQEWEESLVDPNNPLKNLLRIISGKEASNDANDTCLSFADNGEEHLFDETPVWLQGGGASDESHINETVFVESRARVKRPDIKRSPAKSRQNRREHACGALLRMVSVPAALPTLIQTRGLIPSVSAAILDSNASTVQKKRCLSIFIILLRSASLLSGREGFDNLCPIMKITITDGSAEVRKLACVCLECFAVHKCNREVLQIHFLDQIMKILALASAFDHFLSKSTQRTSVVDRFPVFIRSYLSDDERYENRRPTDYTAYLQAQSSVIRTLLSLSNERVLSERMGSVFQSDLLMILASKAVDLSPHDNVRIAAIMTNLTKSPRNAPRLAKNKGFLTALLKQSEDAQNYEQWRCALLSLLNLSADPEASDILVRSDLLADCLLKAHEASAGDIETRIVIIRTIQNLSKNAGFIRMAPLISPFIMNIISALYIDPTGHGEDGIGYLSKYNGDVIHDKIAGLFRDQVFFHSDSHALEEAEKYILKDIAAAYAKWMGNCSKTGMLAKEIQLWGAESECFGYHGPSLGTLKVRGYELWE